MNLCPFLPFGIIIALAFISLPAQAVDLTGTIRDDQGKPLAGASVLISTAGVKTGTSPLCPSCYADCAKKAMTGTDGRFAIADLSNDLRFSIAVVAPGYESHMTKRLDPAKQELLVRLAPLHLDQMDPREYITGRVLDEEGQPVPHAEVETMHGDVEGEGGAISSVFQEFVVTDAQGGFVLTTKRHVKMKEITFRIKARGYASQSAVHIKPRKSEHVFRLNRGVTVSGLLMNGDQPVPNAEVGLVQKERSLEVFQGEQRIGTDAKGRFTFTNIAGDQDWFVYSIMDSVKKLGTTPAVLITLKKPGSHLDAGTLRLQKGLSLTGQVVLDDNGRIPPGTKIMLSLKDAWDHQEATLNAQGQFSFHGLPSAAVSLTTYIRGYDISELNPSLDRYNTRSLIGRLESDVRGLSIWLERQQPGKTKDKDSTARWQALQKSGWSQEKVQQQPLRGFAPP